MYTVILNGIPIEDFNLFENAFCFTEIFIGDQYNKDLIIGLSMPFYFGPENNKLEIVDLDEI